jgi:6-pyruvoyltetrahydropterin/6-carboxytetrahydropterin synthase
MIYSDTHPFIDYLRRGLACVGIDTTRWINTRPPAQPFILPPSRPNGSHEPDKKNGTDYVPPFLPVAETLREDFWLIDEEAVLNPPLDQCYKMAIDIFFNARHFVREEEGAGGEHAHSYRLQVHCQSQSLSTKDHSVVGFSVVYNHMNLVVRAYNNCLLNDLPPFRQLRPTTENLAAILFQQLERQLLDLPVDLTGVTLWESPTKAITYQRRI